MASWDSYTQKATPEDNDTLMIKDSAAGANKRTPFSGVWNWMLNKLANAVISQLETSNKSIIPAINELNSKTDVTFSSVSDFTSKIGEIKSARTYTCYCTGEATSMISNGQSSSPSRGIFSKNNNESTDFFIVTMDASGTLYASRLKNSDGSLDSPTSSTAFSNNNRVVEAITKKYNIPPTGSSPYNIPLDKGSYLISFSQYGSWTNTTALYVVFLSGYEATSLIEKITTREFSSALNIQVGSDYQSVDISNTSAANIKFSIFTIGFAL